MAATGFKIAEAYIQISANGDQVAADLERANRRAAAEADRLKQRLEAAFRAGKQEAEAFGRAVDASQARMAAFAKKIESVGARGELTRGLGFGLQAAGLGAGSAFLGLTPTVAGIGLVGATVGLGVKEALEEEKAIAGVRGALMGVGESVSANMPKIIALAKTIQETTTVSDDAAYKMAQIGVSLGGMTGDQLDRAAFSAIGLSRVLGIDVESAMTLVAKAAQGNVAMLARYGIVIDEAASKAEKLAKVMEFGNRGLAIENEQLQTTTGNLKLWWNALKDISGDRADAVIGWIMPAKAPQAPEGTEERYLEAVRRIDERREKENDAARLKNRLDQQEIDYQKRLAAEEAKNAADRDARNKREEAALMRKLELQAKAVQQARGEYGRSVVGFESLTNSGIVQEARYRLIEQNEGKRAADIARIEERISEADDRLVEAFRKMEDAARAAGGQVNLGEKQRLDTARERLRQYRDVLIKDLDADAAKTTTTFRTVGGFESLARAAGGGAVAPGQDNTPKDLLGESRQQTRFQRQMADALRSGIAGRFA